jgi:prepilin-type N-terminal cleavage/methylation domain-containing protein
VNQRGVTLMEVLIAVTLLSLLSIAMFLAMRIALNAYTKADSKLMDNRRAAGAQRILQQEIEGLMPVHALCGGGTDGPSSRINFFQGEEDVMRLVSTFSLQQGWRGQPQALEFLVIPGERTGVRLVVNENLYTGPAGLGRLCTFDGHFLAPSAGPQSFVLADKLAYCRFAYLEPANNPNDPPVWEPVWTKPGWPLAVRVEMAPLEADPASVQPITTTALINLHRNPQTNYVGTTF